MDVINYCLITYPCPNLDAGSANVCFKQVMFKIIVMIDGWCVSREMGIRWISLVLSDDKSILVQVMAWCRQATSYYLSQCLPSSPSPYDTTRPRWVNVAFDTLRPYTTTPSKLTTQSVFVVCYQVASIHNTRACCLSKNSNFTGNHIDHLEEYHHRQQTWFIGVKKCPCDWFIYVNCSKFVFV